MIFLLLMVEELQCDYLLLPGTILVATHLILAHRNHDHHVHPGAAHHTYKGIPTPNHSSHRSLTLELGLMVSRQHAASFEASSDNWIVHF